MILATLALAAPLVREMRLGLERKYRAKVEREDGDVLEYRLRLRVERPKVPQGKVAETALDVRMTDYRATVGERRVSLGTLGGGTMRLSDSGLPEALRIAGADGRVFLPFLGLLMPKLDADGPVELPAVDLGALSLAGKGTWKRPRLDVDAGLMRDGKEVGKLTLTTTLDREGWPERAEGDLTGPDGAFHFRLQR